MRPLFLFSLLLIPLSAILAQEKTMNTSEDGHMIVHCQVVEKAFVKKNGQVTDHTELYLRLSVQDYFIKFCESSVSREELSNYVSSDLEDLISIKAEVEIMDGAWDNCENEEAQSRIGKYIIIHQLME